MHAPNVIACATVEISRGSFLRRERWLPRVLRITVAGVAGLVSITGWTSLVRALSNVRKHLRVLDGVLKIFAFGLKS